MAGRSKKLNRQTLPGNGFLPRFPSGLGVHGTEKDPVGCHPFASARKHFFFFIPRRWNRLPVSFPDLIHIACPHTSFLTHHFFVGPPLSQLPSTLVSPVLLSSLFSCLVDTSEPSQCLVVPAVHVTPFHLYSFPIFLLNLVTSHVHPNHSATFIIIISSRSSDARLPDPSSPRSHNIFIKLPVTVRFL